MPDAIPTRVKRRWFTRRRFLLASGIVVTILLAVGLLRFRSNREEAETLEIIRRIELSGGKVFRLPWKIAPDVFGQLLEPVIDSILPKGEPYIVYFPENPLITDDEVEMALTRFSHLELLRLAGTSITDRSVKLLIGNRSLRGVTLDRTGISDDAILHLSKLPNLSELSCRHTELTDASVDLLCKMPALDALNVFETKISKDGMRRLEQSNLVPSSFKK